MDLDNSQAAPLNPPEGAAEVKLAGRYLLTSKIARGGLADFWRCEDEVLGRPVAAKILRPQLVAEPAITRLFRKEAVAAARLTHSNIVSVFDTGEHDGAPFIVMEYLGGGSLRDRLDREGPLAPEVVAQIGADACAALGHAHKVGIIHGNIRPENVLFTEGGHLKVSDFAIAKAVLANPRLTDPDGTFSSSAYAAPELASGTEADARSDLYALAVILYECLVGMTPSEASQAAAAKLPEGGERPPTPSPKDLRPEVPDDLDMAIIGSLQRNPAARFQTARALERTLRPLAGGRAAPPAAPPAPPRTRKARPSPPAGGGGGGETQLTGAARPAPVPAPQELRDVPRTPARRAKGDSFLRTEGRWLLPTILVIAAAAAIVFSIPSLRTGIGNVVAPQEEEQAQPLEISRALAYDPPPGDGEETARRLPQAVDGDPDTSWATSSYSRANFGGLKDGVGIYFDLGSARELSGIKVSSVTGGWQASVRVSDDGESWSDPGSSVTAGADHTFDTAVGSHRYWMIWITELVQTSGEGTRANSWVVAIREIEPLAAD